jgi:hypothetical protein
MARVDVLQDVRDRARHEGNILHMSIGLVYDASALQHLPPSAASISVDKAKSMLLDRKPSASSLPLDSKESSSAKNEADLFRFGTLNSIMCNRTMGSNVPLPTWAEVDSPSALRDLSAASKSELEVDGIEPGLYSSSSEEESSSSSSEGSSSSSSSSDDSSEESGDESSDSESTNMDEEESVADSTAMRHGMSAPFNKPEAMMPSLINNAEDDESSFDSSSDSSSGSDDSEDSDDSTEKGEINATTILDMESADLPHVAMEYKKQTSSLSSVAAGLEDLVMTPLVKNKDDISKPSTIDDESGAWKVIVRPELSGGLFVQIRFVHGRSREKEARLLGLDPDNPSTVCLQVHVENM